MKNYKLWITATAFFELGLFGGMIIQQGIIQSTLMKVAGNMDGVEIDINFNETKFIEATKETLVPAIKEAINNSIMSDFKGCKPVPCFCDEWGCALYCMECDGANVSGGEQ